MEFEPEESNPVLPIESSAADASFEAGEICSGPLHPEAVIGLRLFNKHEYFEAHEALETAWRAEKGPIRDLYRGILQVGVAYYHIQRGNYLGARKLFRRCRPWLERYPDRCRGINVLKVRQDFERAEAELIRLGPGNIASFNTHLFQPVEFSTEKE